MIVFRFTIILIILSIIINIVNGYNSNLPKKLQIQQTSFHFLTATGYRASLAGQEWCEEYPVPGGRPYEWSDYRSMAINYLDLYISLQFDIDCEDNLVKFRKLYIDQVTVPAPYSNNSVWWESTFLPLALDAFTCGFKSSKTTDFEFVSSDLRKDFNSDPLKQKVWYMIGDYLTSEFKQRENANRRLDFDAGLYIPFLDKFTGTDYSAEQQLRIGYPSYMGRSLWFIFHTVAQRISDSECDSNQLIYDTLFSKVKDFITLFLYQHPCPICKEHQISRIFVNDRYAKDLIDNEAIRYYPIEHLLLGGIRGDTVAKLSTLNSKDKHSVSAFFWKIHNAVTASVDNGCQCFTEENEDSLTPYHCVFDYKVQIQKQFPRQQRSFPFGKRFEFALTPDHNYTLFDETRTAFTSIVKQINKLDTYQLRSELFKYWNGGITISKESQDNVDQLMVLISNMTTQFLSTNVLASSYSYDQPLVCDSIIEKLNGSYSASLKTPLLKSSFSPSVCAPYIQPSVCDQQYLYKYFTTPPTTPPPTNSSVTVPPKNTTKNVETDSSSSSSISFNFILLSSFILLLLISL